MQKNKNFMKINFSTVKDLKYQKNFNIASQYI